MIHHVSVGSNDIPKAKKFYDAIFGVLGYRLLHSHSTSLDYGTSSLVFSVETPSDGQPATSGNGVHICFSAEDREMVNKFYTAGMENGGRDAGAPGIREKYDPNYYGAFLFDPDGNKIEAVTFMSK
ncbi:MAG: VOC family protein [Bdellovibrionota bacterium]